MTVNLINDGLAGMTWQGPPCWMYFDRMKEIPSENGIRPDCPKSIETEHQN